MGRFLTHRFYQFITTTPSPARFLDRERFFIVEIIDSTSNCNITLLSSAWLTVYSYLRAKRKSVKTLIHYHNKK
jgi:hypothetical protein